MFSLLRFSARASLRTFVPPAARYFPPVTVVRRHRTQLAPRKVKFPRQHKGSVPVRTGGSTKGTTLALGEWGIRVISDGVRLSAKHLHVAAETVRKKIKAIKGAKVLIRVFPHVPVCVKGNETRMGKGKGSFEFWACRVPTGKVILEIGGAPVREELAREALRQAGAKLPCRVEFIHRGSPARLGNLTSAQPSA
ncbi:ribosomal protein L16 [Fistulina hepatica ATCC 64428]|uniref:Ribosomal protein L16 n=1 Tax=Fistulina hepatica ATCC 64428 TaxID=1128425 RepID=A0A0D7A6L5_9AGAR|nr:ribosomal protein L16 [Fistulina hepatica ATCC 64428]